MDIANETSSILDDVLSFGETRVTYYAILTVSILVVLIIIIMIWVGYFLLWYTGDASISIWLPVGITGGLIALSAAVSWWMYPRSSINWDKAKKVLLTLESEGMKQIGSLSDLATTMVT